MKQHNKTFFFLLFLLITYITYLLFKPYLALVIVAFLTSIIFDPVYNYLLKVFRGRSSLANFLTIMIVFLTFLIPLSLLGILVYNQAYEFRNDIDDHLKGEEEESSKINIDDVLADINELKNGIPVLSERENLTRDDVKEIFDEGSTIFATYGITTFIGISSYTLEIIPTVIIFVTLLATLLPGHTNITDYIKKLSPFNDQIDDLYIKRVIAIATSMVRGIFIIAIVQAIISGLSLWIAGVPYIVFWMIIMAFVAIIPLGVGIVTLPIGLVLIATGNTVEGIFVIATYVLIVSNIDNILRPRLVSKEASLHPALVLISILGGVKMFGFLGIIFGPMVMIFFVTSLEIYQKYYRIGSDNMDAEKL